MGHHACCLGYIRLVAQIVGAAVGCVLPMGLAAEAVRSVPVVYCTDLFHPHDDPDDHFDLATLYAMPELDIQGVVLDQGRKRSARAASPFQDGTGSPGQGARRRSGLAPLREPDDQALDQPAEFQGAVLILRTLRASARPVCIATAGTAGLVCAFNREPGLFQTNVAMVLAFIGQASDARFQDTMWASIPRRLWG